MIKIISLLLKYRYFALGFGVVAFIGGAWVHGYLKGKTHERATIAQEQIVLITEAQKDREAIDDKVNKLVNSGVDDMLIGNGWMRQDSDL